MDQTADHVREVVSTLYKYHQDNFLCDLFVVASDGHEIPAHSIILATVGEIFFFSARQNDSF